MAKQVPKLVARAMAVSRRANAWHPFLIYVDGAGKTQFVDGDQFAERDLSNFIVELIRNGAKEIVVASSAWFWEGAKRSSAECARFREYWKRLGTIKGFPGASENAVIQHCTPRGDRVWRAPVRTTRNRQKLGQWIEVNMNGTHIGDGMAYLFARAAGISQN